MIKTGCGIVLLLCALLLAGCGGMARVPEDSFYRLDVMAGAQHPPVPALEGGLVVQGNAAAPLYRDRALLYSEAAAPARVQRYHYHYWADSPPRMVQRGLADYLRAAGVAQPVLSPEDGHAAPHRLRVDIERFEHLRGPDNGHVEVALRVNLETRGRGPLFQDVMHTTAPVSGSEFSAVVDAYKDALGELYRRIAQRLAALD